MQATGELQITIHPGGLPDQRIDTRLLGITCKHFRLPLQSGSLSERYGGASRLHGNVWVAGATSLRLERTSMTTCSGLKPDGSASSWSTFWKYLKLKGSSRCLLAVRAAMSRVVGLPSAPAAPSTLRPIVPAATLSGRTERTSEMCSTNLPGLVPAVRWIC